MVNFIILKLLLDNKYFKGDDRDFISRTTI